MTLLPRLSLAEWATYCLLAAALAVANVYTTLLTGWGAGGSILAVLGAVLVLRARASRDSLNLGQTIASAGASVGFAAAAYAALRMGAPALEPSGPLLVVMFAGLVGVGTVVGAAVRRYMVRYAFPTGTACAVIQRTVTGEGEEARRPVRLLALWGAISAVLTLPTKITLTRGGGALVGALPLGTVRGVPLELGADPLLYGIGAIVGPRVGIGLATGGLLGALVVAPALLDGGVAEPEIGNWMTWLALAALTAPSFATLAFGHMFRVPHDAPQGFEPGDAATSVPTRALAAVAALGTLIAVVAATMLFDLPWYVAVAALALSAVLTVMNGRVMADTDINPVLLSVVVLMTLCAMAVTSSVVMLIGLALIVSAVAGVGVDLMQDYRTGYLLGANSTHQTSAQLVGAIVGVVVAVPFVLVLDSVIGFGEHGLPAPGPRIYTGMAMGLSGGASLGDGLVAAVALVSLGGSVWAFFASWPATRKWMPSLFGIGMGLLLPLQMSLAILLGGLLRAAVVALAPRYERDVTIAGSAVFAAAALVGVLVVLATILMNRAGVDWFFMPPQ